MPLYVDAVTLAADTSCKTKPWVGVAYGEGACLLAAILYIGMDCLIRRARRRLPVEIPLTTGNRYVSFDFYFLILFFFCNFS
jgi:hypothetical protein